MLTLLAADEARLGDEHRLIALVGVAQLQGDKVDRAVVWSSARGTVKNGHNSGQGFAGLQWRKVFVAFLAVYEPHHVETEFGKLLREMGVLPEEKDRRGGG